MCVYGVYMCVWYTCMCMVYVCAYGVGVHAVVSVHVVCMCVCIPGQVQYKMNAVEPERQRFPFQPPLPSAASCLIHTKLKDHLC